VGQIVAAVVYRRKKGTEKTAAGERWGRQRITRAQGLNSGEQKGKKGNRNGVSEGKKQVPALRTLSNQSKGSGRIQLVSWGKQGKVGKQEMGVSRGIGAIVRVPD